MAVRTPIVLTVVLLTAASLHAQVTTGQFSAPTDRGPSSRVGITGGGNTRDTGVSLPGRSGRGSAGNIVRLPDDQQLRRGSPLPPALLPAAFQLGRPGFQFRYGAASRIFRFQDPIDLVRLERLSGLSKSLRRNAPLVDLPTVTPKRARTPYYAPPRPESTFHDFFDLTPAPPPKVEEVLGDAPSLNYADLLRRENEEYRDRKRDLALVEFRKGTDPKQPDRIMHLTRALDLFEGLRRPDATNTGPGTYDEAMALLLLHGYLEKGQVSSAGRTLIDIVIHRPDFFTEKPDISEYFGAKSEQTRVMRENRGVGNRNRTEPVSFGLQAYCHWMLDDRVRAVEALEAMLTLNEELGKDERIAAIGFAMQVALK